MTCHVLLAFAILTIANVTGREWPKIENCKENPSFTNASDNYILSYNCVLDTTTTCTIKLSLDARYEMAIDVNCGRKTNMMDKIDIRIVDLSLFTKKTGVSKDWLTVLLASKITVLNVFPFVTINLENQESCGKSKPRIVIATRLDYFYPNRFKTMEKIELKMIGTVLDDSTKQLIKKMKNLNELELKSCPLNNTDLQILKNLLKLKSLTLSNTGINQIAPGTFSSLVELEELDLSLNELTSLPPYIFRNNTKLKTLYLDGNNISELKIEQFEGAESLEKLYFYLNPVAPETVEALKKKVRFKMEFIG